MSLDPTSGQQIRLPGRLLWLTLAISDVGAQQQYPSKADANKIWQDDKDSTCTPMDSCYGDKKLIPSSRGFCVGPKSGCAGGACLCKDVCMTGYKHAPVDYTHSSYTQSEVALIIDLVEGTREGGTNGAENVECPKSTAVVTDKDTCGENNVVGGDCTFGEYAGGVGICAQNGTSSEIECWDACDYSLAVDDYIVGAPVGTRAKIAAMRSTDCPGPWWLTVLKVLGAIVLVGALFVGIAYACFKAKPRSRKRALEQEPSREYMHTPEPSYRMAPTQSPEPSLPPAPSARQEPPMLRPVAPQAAPMFTSAYTTAPPTYMTYAAPTTQSRASVNSYSGYATLPGASVTAGPASGPLYTAVNTHSRGAEY